MFEGELTREGAQQSVLGAFHPAAQRGRLVIVPEQMEDSVDEVADQLRLPISAEPPGLAEGFVGAEEKLSLHCGLRIADCGLGRLGLRVVEGDYVSASGVVNELFVQTGHGWVSEQGYFEVVGGQSEQVVEQGAGDSAEQPEIHPAGALVIVAGKGAQVPDRLGRLDTGDPVKNRRSTLP